MVPDSNAAGSGDERIHGRESIAKTDVGVGKLSCDGLFGSDLLSLGKSSAIRAFGIGRRILEHDRPGDDAGHHRR